jgi:hypothetical protein
VTHSNRLNYVPGTRGVLGAAFLVMTVVCWAAVSNASTIASSMTGGKIGSAFAPFETLCDGDCSGLPLTPPTHSGAPFDFEYGVRTTQGGIDLTVSSRANIFILGPVRVADSIRFLAKTGIDISGNAPLEAGGEIRIEFPSIPPPVIHPRLPPFNPICGCISIGGGTRIDLTSISLPLGQAISPGLKPASGGDITLVANRALALVRLLDTPAYPGITISRDGDIFLDLSFVELNSLAVKAGKSIVLTDLASMPVPEPGTALLLGLGLAALANSRHRIER